MRLFSALAVLLVASSLALAEPVDNPEYAWWANHTAGSTSTYAMQMNAGGMPMSAEAVITLTSINADEAVVGTDITVTMMGQEQKSPNEQETLHAQVEPAEMDPIARVIHENPDSGTQETITVNGQDYDCTKYAFTDADGMDGEIWLSETVPGGLVKMQSKPTDQAQQGSMTIEIKSYLVAE